MLSFRARGILWYLRTHPGCPTNSSWLCRQAKEGREATRTALVELIDQGYLTEERLRDPETGRWSKRHVLAPNRHPDDLDPPLDVDQLSV
jgi:hypothetical protein